jgi:hypothetical protein
MSEIYIREKDGKRVVTRNDIICEQDSNIAVCTGQDGSLLVVTGDNKYTFEKNFHEDNIKYLMDMDKYSKHHKVFAGVLLNNVRLILDEYFYYGKQGWTLEEVEEELRDSLDRLAKEFDTTLAQLQEEADKRCFGEYDYDEEGEGDDY